MPLTIHLYFMLANVKSERLHNKSDAKQQELMLYSTSQQKQLTTVQMSFIIYGLS